MCGGDIGNRVSSLTSGDGVKKMLLSGGAEAGRQIDSGGRKKTIDLARDKGVIPEKKVVVDPAAERAAAEAAATTAANARIAFQRKAMRDNSLITGGGAAAAGAGRTTLGV